LEFKISASEYSERVIELTLVVCGVNIFRSVFFFYHLYFFRAICNLVLFVYALKRGEKEKKKKNKKLKITPSQVSSYPKCIFFPPKF